VHVLVHLDSRFALIVLTLVEIDPVQTFSTTQSPPVLFQPYIIGAMVRNQRLERTIRQYSLFEPETLRHDQVASEQEQNTDLSTRLKPSTDQYLVVPRIICYCILDDFIESVYFFQCHFGDVLVSNGVCCRIGDIQVHHTKTRGCALA
jgi:hypothetical protein